MQKGQIEEHHDIMARTKNKYIKQHKTRTTTKSNRHLGKKTKYVLVILEFLKLFKSIKQKIVTHMSAKGRRDAGIHTC